MILALIGPSGGGKTLLTANLRKYYLLHILESWTTRKPRDGETTANSGYQFVDLLDFVKKDSQPGFFLWSDVYGDNVYATRTAAIDEALASDALYVASLTPKAMHLLYQHSKAKGLKHRVLYVGLWIDDHVELRRRLIQDNRSDIETRLGLATQDLRRIEELRKYGVPVNKVPAHLPPQDVCAQVVAKLKDRFPELASL